MRSLRIRIEGTVTVFRGKTCAVHGPRPSRSARASLFLKPVLGRATPTQYPHPPRRRSLARSAVSSFEFKNRRANQSPLRCRGRAVRVERSGYPVGVADSAKTSHMKAASSRHRACRVLGALVALLSSAWLASGESVAGCASREYVIASSVESEEYSGLDPELLGQLAGKRSPAPAQPCAGLTCARNSAPPIVPAAPSSHRVDVWGCMNTCPSLRPLDHSESGRADDPGAHPSHTHDSIDRPPRPE